MLAVQSEQARTSKSKKAQKLQSSAILQESTVEKSTQVTVRLRGRSRPNLIWIAAVAAAGKNPMHLHIYTLIK